MVPARTQVIIGAARPVWTAAKSPLWIDEIAVRDHHPVLAGAGRLVHDCGEDANSVVL
jgi:hypothetical protein